MGIAAAIEPGKQFDLSKHTLHDTTFPRSLIIAMVHCGMPVLERRAMTDQSADRRAPSSASLPPPPSLLHDAQDALLLDFDGTLVEIAATPGGIVVPVDLGRTLAALSELLNGRIAIVSGRSIADLDRHLGAVGIALCGSHGGEFRDAGETDTRALVDAFPDAALTQLQDLARDLGNLLVEPKPTGAAIHYREQPSLQPRVDAGVERIAQAHGVMATRGKMVAELVVTGADKGSALAHLMDIERFAGARPIFVGDDVTDEDAFGAAARFGGGGVLVGPVRETAARWHLCDTVAVHGWLAGAIA